MAGVLIVGAGPVGLTLACDLARRGVPFRLIERAAEPPRGSRAKALQPRSLEVLNDLGVAHALMQVGVTELPFRKYHGSQLIGDTDRPVFARDDTRFPKTLLLPQWRVEDALRARLGELGGATQWATELAEFEQQQNGFVCRLQTPSGVEEFGCTYLVACDGGKSTTRKKLGIEFVGETHQAEQMWVGDVELEGLTPDAWYNWLSPKFGIAFALFPFKGTNTWQVQAVMPPDAQGDLPAPTLEGFNRLFQERTQMQRVTFTRSSWQSIFRVNVRRAAKFRVGNAFIAGDAAHVHSIAGGMGMNTGIQDAYNLGWKLAAVMRGEAHERLLDTYAEERIPIADWLLRTTSERQQAMMAGAASGRGGFETIATADTTQLNLNYRGGPLSAPGVATQTGLQAGDRAPDVRLADGRWLSEQLRGPEWKLLAFAADAASPGAAARVIVADDAALSSAYGVISGVVLIRPDGYVAQIAASASEACSYLDRLR